MDTIEIFDDENAMSLDNDFTSSTLYFYPSEKKYKSHMSINDDVYYRNTIDEYKISINAIRAYVRLLERSDEPPLRYAVKDGVVLESEISKDRTYMPGLIKELKEQVEWTEVKYYPILCYILFKHPEIISPDEYRRFLRQTEQRIKQGLIKIENYIKEKDKMGLEIIEGSYGKYIWYPEGKNDVTEDKLKERLEYVEKKFVEPLFDEKSPAYCGISKYEFEASIEILDHLDKLLNNKFAVTKPNQQSSTPKYKGNGIKWTVVIILSLIALSWGIWSAIGVFVLGSIIINIFKS